MKEILELLNNCKTEEDLKKFFKESVDYYTEQSKELNNDSDTIGALVGINPYEDAFNENDYVFSVNSWSGYIPKNMRIVYGSYCDKYNRCYTKGSYYYLDDDSYIYEFIKYIKGKKIENVDDMVLLVHKFLRKFLDKNIDYPSRDDIHQLIYKNDESFFEPVKEHSIRDFYHNGSAMCTEYSVMACNILTIFEVEAMVIFDKKHAYNLIIDDNDKGCVLDYSDIVLLKDLKGYRLGSIPFYEEIEDFDRDMLYRIIKQQEKVKFADYVGICINGSIFKKYNGIVREYGADVEIDISKKLII